MTSAEFSARLIQRGLSRAAAARVLGCSTRSVYRYLSATRHVPATMARLCAELARHGAIGEKTGKDWHPKK